MSDLSQKRSADEIKSESIKRSKKNDDEDTAAEVSSRSPPNEGGESVKQPNSDLTIPPPESVVKQSNSDSAGTTQWKSCPPVYNPDVVPDFSKPPKPPSDLFIPLSKPWTPDPDPESRNKYYVPAFGVPQQYLFDKNRTTAYCIGCGKRTEIKHARAHNATKMPPVKPFKGLFRNPRCKHCAPGPCVGHTLETLASPAFED